MPQQLTFVISDGSGRIGSSERQLIRQRCMQQKNKQPDSRRSKREAARAAAKPPRESGPEDEVVNHSTDGASARSRVQPPSASVSEEQRGLFTRQCILPSPSDWALFPFPEGLEPPAQKLMHEYFIHNPIRDSLYPFKHFGINIDFDDDPFLCFRLLCSEKLCFRAILLLTTASNDLVLQRPLSSATYQHLRRVLPLLNRRLSEKEAYQNDIILYVVGILASIAVLFGDYHAAQKHAVGLSEIIRLRGSWVAVNNNPAIQLSMDRLNFYNSLVTKLWTPIYDRSAWEAPVFPIEVVNFHQSQNMLCVDGLVDSNLAAVFKYVQHTTILFNAHYHSKTPMNGAFVRQCLGFVHSGLIELEGSLTDDLSKHIRLGILVYLATTFRIPGCDEQYYCRSLATKMQLAYISARPLIPVLYEALNIWLMFMAQICISLTSKQQGGDWDVLKISGLGWDETRRGLQQVMWIDAFHDDLGRRAFEKLTKPR